MDSSFSNAVAIKTAILLQSGFIRLLNSVHPNSSSKTVVHWFTGGFIVGREEPIRYDNGARNESNFKRTD